jgi:hypothetical protein
MSFGLLTIGEVVQSMTSQLPLVPGTQAVLLRQQLSPLAGVGTGVGAHAALVLHSHSLCCMQWLEIWVTGSFEQSYDTQFGPFRQQPSMSRGVGTGVGGGV